MSVHFLDGKKIGSLLLGWSGYVFVVGRQPQETFGLAPVEAMAAGIPVVVSDWDGYRYTVSDGIGGFRIPTLAPSHSQQGEELALQHDHGLLLIRTMSALSHSMWLSIRGRCSGYCCLAEDPALRQRMGAAGSQTVQQRFNWPVVAGLHHQLCAELAERRSAERESFGVQGLHPLRSDHFRDFAPFATACLRPDTKLRLAMPFPELHHRLNNLTSLDRCYEQLHASPLDLQRLLALLQSDGPCSLDRLLSSWPAERHDVLRLSLPWLAKLGLSTGLSPQERDDSERKYLSGVCLSSTFDSRRIATSSASGLNTSRCSSRFCSDVVLRHHPPFLILAAVHALGVSSDSPAQRRLVFRPRHQPRHHRLR